MEEVVSSVANPEVLSVWITKPSLPASAPALIPSKASEYPVGPVCCRFSTSTLLLIGTSSTRTQASSENELAAPKSRLALSLTTKPEFPSNFMPSRYLPGMNCGVPIVPLAELLSILSVASPSPRHQLTRPLVNGRGMLNAIESKPVLPFASSIAWRKEPAPLSAVLVTVKTAGASLSSSRCSRGRANGRRVVCADRFRSQLGRFIQPPQVEIDRVQRATVVEFRL